MFNTPSKDNKDILDSFFIQAVDQFYENEILSSPPVKSLKRSTNLSSVSPPKFSLVKEEINDDFNLSISSFNTSSDSKNSSTKKVASLKKSKIEEFLSEGGKEQISLFKEKSKKNSPIKSLLENNEKKWKEALIYFLLGKQTKNYQKHHYQETNGQF